MIKILRSQDVWQPKLGAPRGNRNHFRHGRSTTASKDMRKRIADFRRRAKAALEDAKKIAANEAAGDDDRAGERGENKPKGILAYAGC